MRSPDSSLLQRVNTLKQAASYELLTESQKEVVDEIEAYREAGKPRINLYGASETGKTFLCWVLHNRGPWRYYPRMVARVDSPTVIYDHASAEREAARKFRTNIKTNSIRTGLYVTRVPAAGIYPRIELDPPQNHFEAVQETWDELGLDPDKAPPT